MLDFSRIQSMIDIERMRNSRITLIGTGAGANLARNLVRCGLGAIDLVDFDFIEEINLCRQEHMHDNVGMSKVEALAPELFRINPDLKVTRYPKNFCSFTDAEIDERFRNTDLFIFCVDNLAANARGNEHALRMGKPAVWSGVYPRGGVGEIVLWLREFRSCYRCLCGARYRAHAARTANPNPTDSVDILSMQFVDAITGMIAIGILTRGADNHYGRLLEPLIATQRNFLQVKIDPDWTWAGRDIFREQLQIPQDCPAYFSWVTIARSDPDKGEPPCADCIKYLGRHTEQTSEHQHDDIEIVE